MDFARVMIGRLLILVSVAFNGVIIASSTSCPVDWGNEQNITENLDLIVTCSETYIEVSIAYCILLEAGYATNADITVNGGPDVTEQCDDVDVRLTMERWVGKIDDPFNKCGTTSEVSDNGETITYSNFVSVFQFSDTNNAIISRMRHHYLPFSCNYTIKYYDKGVQDSSMPPYHLNADQDPQKADELEEDGEFAYEIRCCLDTDCDTEIPVNYDVLILTEIYIIITTPRDVYIYICGLIAQNSESNPIVTYTIATTDGCLVEGEVLDGATIDSNTRGMAIICLRAFQWGGSCVNDPVYFIVTFGFCDPNSLGLSCTPPCGSNGSSGRRRRRSALSHLSDHETATTAIAGPWNVV